MTIRTIPFKEKGTRYNVDIEMELENNENGFPVFTASAEVYKTRKQWIMGGQCIGEIAEVESRDAEFQEIKGLWQKYHLNDLNAGTAAQEDCLKEAGLTGASKYSEACEYLKQHGLYEVELSEEEARYNPKYAGMPYKYGHGWLYRPIPENDLQRIKEIMGVD